MSGGLGVVVDGTPMPEGEARAFWQRFSAYMEEHKGDLAGFAKQEGLASVHPAMEGGRPVLVASRTAAQRPYVSVARGDGGSSAHQPAPPRSPRGPRGEGAKRGGKTGKPAKRR